MRQLMFDVPGTVSWHDTAWPRLPAGHAALVRPLAVARCDLDAPMATFGLFPGPFAVGHEMVAEVMETGSDVESFRAGDRVSVPFQVSCGTCAACSHHDFSTCTTYRAPAGAAWGFGERGGGHPGAVAELVAVPHADHMLMPVPAGLSDAALATLPDNVADAYRAVGPALADHPGADVLVLAGAVPSIGLYAVALATALGARTVRYVDVDDVRCAAAERLGANVTQHGGTLPRRFDRAPITVDGTGTGDGLSCAVRSTEDSGVCTMVSIVFGEATVPLLEMYTRRVSLVTARADSRRFLPAVLELAAERRFDPLAIPTSIVRWDEADAAWLVPDIKLVVVR